MLRIASAIGLTTAAAVTASAVGLTAEQSPPAKALDASSAVERRESPRTADPKAQQEQQLAKLRLREGTRLRDAAGRFRQTGDSLVFIDGEGREISGLPNLNLERILRMLKTVEEPESITWSVTGTVTEFSGRNYLLITRAVYKAAAPPPAPETLEELTTATAESEPAQP